MYSNRVIKTKRIDAEKISGPLHVGLNEIKTTVKYKYSTVKMGLEYAVIVPYDQRNGDDFCFISFSSIKVSGRGSKSYGEEVARDLFNTFYKIEVNEDEIYFHAEATERQILTGYHSSTLEAAYMTIRFIEFASENDIDLTTEEIRRFVPSRVKELNRLYYTVNSVENGTLFIMDNGYYRYKGNTEDCYELSCARQLSHLKNTNSHYIVDSRERVWELQAVFTSVENVQAEVQSTYDFFVVSNGKLHKEVPLFGDKSKKDKYIAYKDRLFAELSNNVYLLSDAQPVPVFETNLSSSIGYEGGVYSTVMLNGTKTIIVPYRFVSCSSTEREKEDVVVVDHSIYGIVGPYNNVGFIGKHYGFNDWLVVGQRPSDEHVMFYESYDDVPLGLYEELRGQKAITMTFFDKAFELRKPLYRVGDKVRVVKELGPTTQVKGLEGVVTDLSCNRAKIEIMFFGVFQARFNLDQIERILENSPIDRIELSPEETIESIKTERRITIIWENGFEESSPTTNAFKEFYGEERVENYCLPAYLGQNLEHTIFLVNGESAVQEARELILAGEYSCVILDDRDHERGPNFRYVIYNADAA